MSVPAIQGRLSALDFDLDSPSYVVRAGDTAPSIAFRYRLSEQELARLNPGVDLRRLAPGMQVYVRTPYQSVERVAANRLPGFSGPQGEFNPSVSSNQRFDGARTSPTLRSQPQVIVGTAVSDSTLLGSRDDYVNRLPPMRVGTFDENAFPVEEVVSNDYQIPETSPLANMASDSANSMWRWPTIGRVARTFNPARPNGRAIDIAGMVGQNVVAVADGTVIFAGRDPSNVGKVVIIKHANDYISVYSHTKDLNVATNETVKAGDTIASLGANPDDESMLRFELRRNGTPLNPLQILPRL